MNSAMSQFCHIHEHGVPGSRTYDAYNFSGEVTSKVAYPNEHELVVSKLVSKFGKLQTYVVGYLEGKDHDLQHENAHAMFGLCSKRREWALKMWESLDASTLAKVKVQMKLLRYPESVHLDEFQAYIDDKDFWSRKMDRELESVREPPPKEIAHIRISVCMSDGKVTALRKTVIE